MVNVARAPPAGDQRTGLRIEERSLKDAFGAGERKHSVLVGDGVEVLLLRIRGWILEDPRWVGMVLQILLALEGKGPPIRILSQGVNLPKRGYRKLFEKGRSDMGLDLQFIPWADLSDLASDAFSFEEILGIPKQPAVKGARVFVSYAHDDKDWLDRLVQMYSPLGDQGSYELWVDTQIKPGEDWAEKIDRALREASAAILLVTPAFLASEFIKNVEFPDLLEAAKKRGLKIFWIYVKFAHWDKTPLARIQSTHPLDAPLEGLPESEQNKALFEITKAIDEALG